MALSVVSSSRLPGQEDGIVRGVPIGAILLDRGLIDEAQLADALVRSRNTRRRVGEILVADGAITPTDLVTALGDQLGLCVVDLDQDPPDPSLFDAADAVTCLEHRIIPWRRLGPMTQFVTSEPATASLAIAKLSPGNHMAFVSLATPAQVENALGVSFGPPLAERAAHLLPAAFSVRSLTTARIWWGASAILVIVALLAAGLSPILALAIPMAVLSIATTILRLAALIAGSRPDTTSQPQDSETIRLADKRPLPRVSILVPLFREAEMIPRLVAALSRLDYPRELLDVRLLLEEADKATADAVRMAEMPSWITPLVVPDGQPRTKPRALNYALDFCDGEIVGILDAEDRPDPRQIREVAEYIRNAPQDTACVQCQLSYFNARENWITRCFHVEYAIWFSVLLGGFQRLGLPIPLGGTSVYLRRSAIGKIGGWDAHNVTEDADLGMRLARNGLSCTVLTSVTEEEANCRALPWVRQRSRWLKGYLLTWLSHMRAPGKLWHDLGPKGFLALNVLFLGGAISYLAMPLFWTALISWAVSGKSIFAGVLPDAWVVGLGWLLGIGQAVMLGCAGLALWRRRALDLMLWVPVLPIYWTLGALAAWKAVIEVFLAPYYWDKTRHGITAHGPDHQE